MGTTGPVCEYCDGEGWWERQIVTGTWGDWDGPQPDWETIPCPHCEAGRQAEADSEPDYEAQYTARYGPGPDFEDEAYW